MEKRRRITICAGSGSLAAFALWTWAVCRIGVQPIGPNGSRVGFGEMNHWFHQLIRRRSIRQTPARPAAMRRFFFISYTPCSGAVL